MTQMLSASALPKIAAHLSALAILNNHQSEVHIMLADILALNILMELFMFCFIWWVLDVVGKWVMFNKMGEAGWKSIIPIYSDYIVFKNVWQPIYFFILLAISIFGAAAANAFNGQTGEYIGYLLNCVSFIIFFLENIKLSRSFGHGYLFGLGLLVFNPFFTMILGFGSSRYLGNFSSGT